MLQLQFRTDASGLDRKPMILDDLVHDAVESQRRQIQTPDALLGAMVIEQVLDQRLKLHALLLQNGDDFPLRSGERSDGSFDQQFRALPQRRERSLQLMG